MEYIAVVLKKLQEVPEIPVGSTRVVPPTSLHCEFGIRKDMRSHERKLFRIQIVVMESERINVSEQFHGVHRSVAESCVKPLTYTRHPIDDDTATAAGLIPALT
jgi:hypothetical protein